MPNLNIYTSSIAKRLILDPDNNTRQKNMNNSRISFFPS